MCDSELVDSNYVSVKSLFVKFLVERYLWQNKKHGIYLNIWVDSITNVIRKFIMIVKYIGSVNILGSNAVLWWY